MTKRVSPSHTAVIIPAYDIERWLPRSIESVVSQTTPNWRLYVGYYPSVDRTEEIVRNAALADPRVTAIRGRARNVAELRNAALEAALKDKPELVAFLDGDDIWYSNFLTTTTWYLSKLPKSTICVFAKADIVDEHDRIIGSFWDEIEQFSVPSRHVGPMGLDELIMSSMAPDTPSATVFRSEVFRDHPQLRFNGGFIPDDAELWFHAAHLTGGSFLGIPNVLFGYRRHDAQQTTAINRLYRDIVRIYETYVPRMKNRDLIEHACDYPAQRAAQRGAPEAAEALLALASRSARELELGGRQNGPSLAWP